MAKPGSGAARRIVEAGRAATILSDQQARELQEQIEMKLGGRCNGCGRRVTIGFRFTSIDVRDADGRHVITFTACTRADCDFAMVARDGATCVEPVEFSWVDENGPDAPAAAVIVRRNERMAEQAAAAEAAGG